VKIPATREHVRLDGRNGIFLVLWVDRDQQVLNVVPLAEGDAVETVPFSWVRPAREDELEVSGA
jgi:hypothetical protein